MIPRTTILLVSDSKDAIAAVQQALAGDPDAYEVIVATTFAAARAAASARIPAVALVEPHLPDGSAASWVAENDDAFPVLLLMPNGPDGHELPAGILDCMVKSPAHYATLPHAVKRARREWAHHQEFRHVEQALQDSEDRYARIIRAVTDYIFTVRVEGGRAVATTHGPGCLAVTGYKPQDFTDDPTLWLSMVVAEDRSAVLEQARRILAGEVPPPIEHRIVHRIGTERWVRNTFVPHRDEHNVLVAYDGLIQDITVLKQTELALAHSEARLRRAEQVARFGHLEINFVTQAVTVSAGARQICGIADGHLMLSELQALCLPQTRHKLDEAIRDLIESGRPHDSEFQIRRATDGQTAVIHVIA